MGGRIGQGVWDPHVYTAIFKMDNLHRELCSTLCGSLDGRGVWGENGYMYMYGWVPLLCTRNYHNIVDRLCSNIKLKVLKNAC